MFTCLSSPPTRWWRWSLASNILKDHDSALKTKHLHFRYNWSSNYQIKYQHMLITVNIFWKWSVLAPSWFQIIVFDINWTHVMPRLVVWNKRDQPALLLLRGSWRARGGGPVHQSRCCVPVRPPGDAVALRCFPLPLWTDPPVCFTFAVNSLCSFFSFTPP